MTPPHWFVQSVRVAWPWHFRLLWLAVSIFRAFRLEVIKVEIVYWGEEEEEDSQYLHLRHIKHFEWSVRLERFSINASTAWNPDKCNFNFKCWTFFLLHCTRSLFNSSFVTVGTKKQALKAIHVDMTLRKRVTKKGKRDGEEKCIPFT